MDVSETAERLARKGAAEACLLRLEGGERPLGAKKVRCASRAALGWCTPQIGERGVGEEQGQNKPLSRTSLSVLKGGFE